MNFKSYFLAICALMILSSCNHHIYGPALFQQDIAYQPKPASYDTVKSATYVSGGVDFYTDPTWTNMQVSGQFNISRGHVFNHFNLAYGAFGVLGDYSKGSYSNDYPNEKFPDIFFGAGGARASANLFTSYDRMDFRYLGFEVAYSHEFGAYADFRKTASMLPNYHIDTRTDLMTIGLTSEIIFHNENDRDIQNGIRFFFGETLGDNTFNNLYLFHRDSEPDFLSLMFVKVSYFFKYKQYFSSLEAGKQVFFRVGYSF